VSGRDAQHKFESDETTTCFGGGTVCEIARCTTCI
jgi:hypothetical protein